MTTTTTATERVGRYQLLEPIGIGPSGAVSRAKVFGVAGFERQFAVKRFHAELTSTAAMAAMLSAAARSYGSLEHPRIARMSEFGVAQGATFTAVEYVPGLDALRLIAEARLAGASASGLVAGGALALVSQAARAVGYAHGRGLTHLGLAPSNVIVTADGDIKITDFGILSATLPQRPIEVSRLAQRIPYLAPEQLANEATSAATDVFALGVLAYELVTGTRTFKGDTPQQVASSIMTGPPPEPPLPRPIVRVLQRCLARSPFERFPDARALADALDAALRVAPVPGTRKDIGAQVKETLDRLAALNEGQMSGVVALHLGTGPIRRLDDGDPPRAARAGSRASEAYDPDWAPPYELAPPDPAAGERVTLSGGAVTLADLPRTPMTTVPGLAPPPIPVPPGLGPPATPPPPGLAGTSTLLGVGRTPPAAPQVKARPGSVSGVPPVPPAARRPPTRLESDLAIPIDPGSPDAHPGATGESAIHPLDPSELEPIDPVSGDVEPAAEGASSTMSAPAAEPAMSAAPPSAAASVTASVDDFLDAPTHAVADDERAADRPGRPAAPTFRMDPSSVDTRPIAPAALEPLLLDPTSRPTPRPTSRPTPRPSGRPTPRPGSRPGRVSDADHDEETLDDPHGFGDPSAGRAPTLPGDTRSAPAAEPRLGQTMLGFGAPPVALLETAPAPDLPVPALGPDRKPDGDQLSELMLEGFRATPAPVVPEEPAIWPRETGGLPLDDVPPAPSAPDPAQPPPGWTTAPVPPTGPIAAPDAARPRQPARWIVAGMLGAAAVGVTAWQVYARLIAPSDRRTSGVAAAPRDAQIARAPAGADTPRIGSGSAPAAPATGAPGDARAGSGASSAAMPGASPPGDAGPAPSDARVPPGPPTATGDSLTIASTPPGARVFLDGADAGTTPLTLPGSPDRHAIALLLAGHELYLAQVDGHGTFQVPLKEVTPTSGPAGIKVLRCKDKERHYVFVDGKPTGQTCPTERIGCELGPHTVETYDVVSETRRKWDIVVKDTRLSFRVRVDP